MRVTILKDVTKSPSLHIHFYHDYHEDEEYEVGSLLMPQSLADYLVGVGCARMENKPITDKAHAAREQEYLKRYSDGQQYSVNYPPGM